MASKKNIKAASDKALLASVKEEMTRPSMSKSAREEAEKQSHARFKRDRQPA